MADSAPTIIFGTAGIAAFDEPTKFFEVLDKHNVKTLDTARLYGESEAVLGKYETPKKYIIHTKAMGFSAGSMTKEKIIEGMATSLKNLNTDSVEILYLHSPDPDTPIEDTLAGIQEVYAAGKFKKFGLSNFRAPDVQKIYDIQKAANSVLPTVFQGNYSAVSRHIETDLFPLLHKLKISFNAYSPIAGGFLVKESAQLREKDDHGRFGKNSRIGNMYIDMYGKESLYQALDEWGVIAKDAGISKAALAYRWIAYHSALKKANGDGIIVGASKTSQLEETLTAIEQGPLDANIAKRASDIWAKVEKDAPLDNWNSFASKQG